MLIKTGEKPNKYVLLTCNKCLEPIDISDYDKNWDLFIATNAKDGMAFIDLECYHYHCLDFLSQNGIRSVRN